MPAATPAGRGSPRYWRRCAAIGSPAPLVRHARRTSWKSMSTSRHEGGVPVCPHRSQGRAMMRRAPGLSCCSLDGCCSSHQQRSRSYVAAVRGASRSLPAPSAGARRPVGAGPVAGHDASPKPIGPSAPSCRRSRPAAEHKAGIAGQVSAVAAGPGDLPPQLCVDRGRKASRAATARAVEAGTGSAIVWPAIEVGGGPGRGQHARPQTPSCGGCCGRGTTGSPRSRSRMACQPDPRSGDQRRARLAGVGA